ncbi:MAG: M56 family metallopeptidase, partial [Candidatus Aminicenantes bacterium]
ALRLTRRGIPLKGYPWQQLFQLFSTNTLKSLKRKVRLVKSQGITVPMTWGVLKPVVLMPSASSQWPLEQCSSVLFHELSHIKRWDFLVTLLSRISCCFYWFNPLSWMVFKRLRMEQEKACDEMVLQAGIKPSTYASSLLHLKQAIDNRHYQPSPALSMARGSELHERLTTILAKQIKIKEIKMKTKIMLLILVFLTVTFIGTAKPNPPAAAKDETAVTSTYEAPQVQTAQEEKKEGETIKTKTIKKDEHYIAVLIKDSEKGQSVKIEFLPGNEITNELLEKIKKMTRDLQNNLPEPYKLESKFDCRTSRSITFVWPLKVDKKTHVEALKHFSKFLKELEKLFSSSKGKKPLKKKITIINEKEKGAEV